MAETPDEFDVELEEVAQEDVPADAVVIQASGELNEMLAERSRADEGDSPPAALSERVVDVGEMTAQAWREKEARDAGLAVGAEPPQAVTPEPLSAGPPEAPVVAIGELVEEEEPPDETQPLLPAVNKSVGPETAAQRAERYRLMRNEAYAEMEAQMPEDSVWRSFIRNELERDARMEPIRLAFIKSMQKGER